MSINWKELELILSELPLKDSYIQKITEHDFHSFTLHLFSKNEKSWLLYTEIATPKTRICRTDKIREKSKKSQRFTQYIKAHLIGKKIIDVKQAPFDRAFTMILSSSDEILKLVFRLFSGPSANIIITDKDDKILELMFRRPERGESQGNILKEEIRESEGARHFEVRPYDGDSFNSYIDKAIDKEDYREKEESAREKIAEKRDKELDELYSNLQKQKEKEKNTSDYDELKESADLLQANIYMLNKGMDRVTLKDYAKERDVTISLDPALNPAENVEKLYTRYKKDKRANELVKDEIKRVEEEIEEKKAYYENLLSADLSLSKLRKEAGRNDKPTHLRDGKPGLYIESEGWTLIVGRNAKENDSILRSGCKGNDIWLHTRDFAGGYVIIKCRKDKTVPLSVLLDAASLAIHFSKARSSNKAELYYTEVKYLKRIKGAKTGLIIPTQERNIHGELDEERIRRMLGR